MHIEGGGDVFCIVNASLQIEDESNKQIKEPSNSDCSTSSSMFTASPTSEGVLPMSQVVHDVVTSVVDNIIDALDVVDSNIKAETDVVIQTTHVSESIASPDL